MRIVEIAVGTSNPKMVEAERSTINCGVVFLLRTPLMVSLLQWELVSINRTRQHVVSRHFAPCLLHLSPYFIFFYAVGTIACLFVGLG